jgi:hypothetical protein
MVAPSFVLASFFAGDMEPQRTGIESGTSTSGRQN